MGFYSANPHCLSKIQDDCRQLPPCTMVMATISSAMPVKSHKWGVSSTIDWKLTFEHDFLQIFLSEIGLSQNWENRYLIGIISAGLNWSGCARQFQSPGIMLQFVSSGYHWNSFFVLLLYRYNIVGLIAVLFGNTWEYEHQLYHYQRPLIVLDFFPQLIMCKAAV